MKHKSKETVRSRSSLKLGRSPESILAEQEYGSVNNSRRSKEKSKSAAITMSSVGSDNADDEISLSKNADSFSYGHLSPSQSVASIGSHSRSTRLSFGVLSADESEYDDITLSKIGKDLSEMALEFREKGPSIFLEWIDFGSEVKEISDVPK
mmetsp:Transcript_14015/g.20714  ORF Transcript_14015/g.20714 Transcript_14015/m.20714 type:complete len:152 (+) Transcript_14015:984-1439(+)